LRDVQFVIVVLSEDERGLRRFLRCSILNISKAVLVSHAVIRIVGSRAKPIVGIATYFLADTEFLITAEAERTCPIHLHVVRVTLTVSPLFCSQRNVDAASKDDVAVGDVDRNRLHITRNQFIFPL
jgi:hypothetical protein